MWAVRLACEALALMENWSIKYYTTMLQQIPGQWLPFPAPFDAGFDPPPLHRESCLQVTVPGAPALAKSLYFSASGGVADLLFAP